MVFGCWSYITSFKNQRFEALKKDAQDTGVLFSDDHFPADNSSLAFSAEGRSKLPRHITWKRPKDLCEKPKLFVDGTNSCDVIQGMLGNCWFVAACSALAQEKELWHRVIPDYREQEFDETFPENYAGIFHFRFWQFGKWVDIVIDDKLPTANGELIYLRSREKNEFWGPLLEKAYAKLFGSYEALDGGKTADALVDFTGGISEIIELQKEGYFEDQVKQKQLFKMMVSAMDNHSLLCCCISALTLDEMEQRTDLGLVKGHAYGITSIKKVNISGTGLMSFFLSREKLYMIRLRNPWGGKEWTGAFSDNSPEWMKISDSDRNKIGLTFQEDGEFWMTFDDFCKQFTDLSICYLMQALWFSFGHSWRETCFHSQWTIGPKYSKSDRAGGCMNNKNTFLQNPQFRFDITDAEDTVIVYLSQKDKRSERSAGMQHLVIGMEIIQLEENRKLRLHDIKPTAATSDYIRTRSIFLRSTLKRGRYALIPTTFDPEETGDFMLRIFTNKEPFAKEMKRDVPVPNCCPCTGYPSVVTIIVVQSASGLMKQDRFGSADPYCIIKCEGEYVQSKQCKDTLDPMWNVSAIFYRKTANSPIKIQIWNKNVVMDSHMGTAIIKPRVSLEPILHELDLYGRRHEKNVLKPGKLLVTVTTSDDLMTF